MARRATRRQKRARTIPTRGSRRTTSETENDSELLNAAKRASAHEYAREPLELGHLNEDDEPEPSREMLNFINRISSDAKTTARAKFAFEDDVADSVDSDVDDCVDGAVKNQHLVELEVPVPFSPKALEIGGGRENDDERMADATADGNSEHSPSPSEDLGYEIAPNEIPAYETAAEYEAAGDVYDIPHLEDEESGGVELNNDEPNNEEPGNGEPGNGEPGNDDPSEKERIPEGSSQHIIGEPVDLGISWIDQDVALQSSIARDELNGAACDNHLGDVLEEDTRRASPKQNIRTPPPNRSGSGLDALRSDHAPLTPYSEAQSQEEPDHSIHAIDDTTLASTCTKLVSTEYVQQMIRLMPKDAWTQVKSNWQETLIKTTPSSRVAPVLKSAMQHVWSLLREMPSAESREAHVRYIAQNRAPMGESLAKVSRRTKAMGIAISNENHAERGTIWSDLIRCIIPMHVLLLEMVMKTANGENDDANGRRNLPVSGTARLSLFGLFLATRLNGELLKLADAVERAAKRDMAMRMSVRKDRGRILGLAKSLQQQLMQDTAELEELEARPKEIRQAKERDARIRAWRAESMQRYEESRRSKWQRFCDASHRETPQGSPKSSQSVQQASETEPVSSADERLTRCAAMPDLRDYPEAVPERPAGLGETREWLMEDCERLLTIIRDGEKLNYPVIARQMGRSIEDVAFQVENIKYAVRKSMFQTEQVVPRWAIAGME